ncbi:MAG: OmpA family protein [Myxococcales bacterium]|nr:OmpA family protein [Myxococcales bacterium]
MLLLVCSPAHANVEVGGLAGIHVFSDHSELGATDGPNAPSQRNSALFGVRIGAYLGDLIGLEGELGVLPTEAREAKFGVTDLTYRAHLVLQLRAKVPDAIVLPFVLVGAGGFSVVASSNAKFKTDPLKDLSPDTDPAFYVGAGVKLRLDERLGVRLDVRALMMPSSENTVPANLDSQKQTLDLEALASVYFELGRTPIRTPPPPPPPPPPDDDDRDHDGVRGRADQCPSDAEDLDGWRDDDGCPDPDNDGDGVADAPDAHDRCPNDAEDKDGFQDDDGCPDPDNDTDGIADAQDRCPLQPEDRDGWQDDDGCPDPDNDGDGVADAADACLDALETKNGYEDTDGCPDELPAAAKRLEGVIAGVAFAPTTTIWAPGATKALDAVALALTQLPALRITIAVHTDDVVLTRGLYADNLELSQARAEVIAAYLVRKGIDAGRLVAKGYGETVPRVAPAGLTGKKLTAARAYNRRVELHLLSPLD